MPQPLFLHTRQAQKVMKIMKHIHDNLDSDLTIGTLAALYDIGASTLRSHFLAFLKKPIHVYINESRIEKAKALLLEDKHTINEISIQVGYSERNAFTRAFSKIVGCSPAKFVKESVSL